MTSFAFDPKKSADENIAAFFDFLTTVDPECNNILRDNVSSLLPLPPPGPQRTIVRQAFNEAVKHSLSAIEGSKGES